MLKSYLNEPVKNRDWLYFFPRFIVYVLCFVPFLLGGCIATSYEMNELKTSINQLKKQIGQLQKNQADLSSSMESVNNNMVALTEKLEDNKNRMSLLAQRMDDIQADISQRVSILTEKLSGSTPNITPVPTDMYQLSFSDYSKGKYDLAIVGFKTYMEKYPGTELATKSQYYLSDCYFNKGAFKKALNGFNKLIKKYPQSEFILSAKYKKALCLLEMKKVTSGKKLLEDIVKYNPNTQEAKQAEEKLKSIISP